MSVEVIIDNCLTRVLQALRRFDEDFVPSLSSRVNLNDYANKLASHAYNVFLVDGDIDVGHAAIYVNDAWTRKAFLSSICVASEYRGGEFADMLLSAVVRLCRAEGAKSLALKVNEENARAVAFYLSEGFVFDENDGECLVLSLAL